MPIRRRAKAQSEVEEHHLSFVLIREPVAVDGRATLSTYSRLFAAAPALAISPGDDSNAVEFLSRDRKTKTFVAPMPVPIPDQEADRAADQSLCTFAAGGFVLHPHTAHFVVSTRPSKLSVVDALRRHTLLVAAVAEAHEAVGVYEGNAGATHSRPFYVDVSMSEELPLPLWSGVSVARPGDGTISLLTLGMSQLHLPNLLVVGPEGGGNDALNFAFDLLGYVISRGAAIGEGETVGRTADEKIKVHYVPSPIDSTESVARIEFSS